MKLMTSDMLSQEEIDALLNGNIDNAINDEIDDLPINDIEEENLNLSHMEIDALGEIGNISMGTAATTLFTLLGQKVLITTPKVEVTTVEKMAAIYPKPYVAVDVKYKVGLVGSNMLVLKEDDVKIIANLMMGGDGKFDTSAKILDEMDLSAISEAMNQMVGSSSTSLSEMFLKKIDIAPPKAHSLLFENDDILNEVAGVGLEKDIVKISFRMVIGDLIDSEIMQLLPISFAKSMVSNLLSVGENNIDDIQVEKNEQVLQDKLGIDTSSSISYNNTSSTFNNEDDVYQKTINNINHTPVNVSKVTFDSFENETTNKYNEGINMIENIPIEITVELGRTTRKISEILEFGSGTIIELDKLVGEPLEILANGKYIAKGEVVVIDDNFGIRVTDIVTPSKRVGKN
ncbi:flagellar motor switch phosphatase FliY [Abyssisolibacter fermentans]|uniref:flagellar motor switch phosphatase FliY n=1 Tax=Abyssisolibacter fermentans TaxID=1766203 RepID=UPI000B2C8A6A|nr:flagellar motor switch phosphatase FliY [Abyssisolibacter fermentans]